jgi:hypothetical protein
MRSLLIPSMLVLSSLSLFAGCLAASPEPIDGVSQAVVPPPGGCGGDELVTRTQGFWQNHSCVVKGDATGYSLLPVTLGSSFELDKPSDVEAYLDQPTQGDKQIILGHQLLAAKLNVAAFAIGGFEFADWDADGNLETVDELIAIGDGLFDAGSDADRVKSATVLDKLNNAGTDADLWFDPNCNNPPASCE